MFSSKDQEVFFDSNLTDVEIYIDNVYTCTTPCIAQVERMRKEMTVTAKKQGYDEINIRTNSNITTATLFNISMTGLSSIGTSIDMTSGHDV